MSTDGALPSPPPSSVQMDTSGLAATVVSTAERFGARNASPHVVYLLRLDLGPHERWYVERRFSAFRRLRKELAHSHAELVRDAPPLLRAAPTSRLSATQLAREAPAP